MLLRSLPDTSQKDPEFENRFLSRWGRENCIIWRHVRYSDFGPYAHSLSIRAVLGGVEHCHVDGRTIAVDDDNFLILNHGRTYSTNIRATQPVESLAICFSPELVERIAGDVAATVGQALDRGQGSARKATEFFENLQPHEGSISPVLRYIRAHLMSGLVDEAWYDEQLIFLLARMQSRHEKMLAQHDQLAAVRSSTRREAYRRIGLATDFIHTNFTQDLDLGVLARTAFLSKYHFLRLFTSIHGITPHAYLRRKRTMAAVRLLQSTRLTVNDVAQSVGMNVSTLMRQSQHWTKLTPRQIRDRVRDRRTVAYCTQQSAIPAG